MFGVSPEALTQTDETKANYVEMAQRLIFNMEQQTQKVFEEDPQAIIDALAEHMRTKAKKTILNYRNAMRYYLASIGHPWLDYAVEKLWSVKQDPEAHSESRIQRLKEVPTSWIQNFHRIALKRLRSPNAFLAYAIIRCGSIFGLRPSEWFSAQLIQKNHQLLLVVKNGKHTNGRSFGESRTLIIQKKHIEPKELEMLEWLLNKAHECPDAKAWREKMNEASNSLSYLRKYYKELAKYPVSLYSGRHQFVANAKRAGFGSEEIAAMLGHKNRDVARRNYGVKMKGDLEKVGAFPVLPSQADLDRVYLANRTRHREVLPSWIIPDTNKQAS